jgi:crotonobetainyl-CoA:carnitine CoA-transferase CaiB-like acyl-CoA transferase
MRVLELGELITVPYAGRVLYDLGAEVVKVELLPSGDVARRYGPFPPGEDPATSQQSGLFTYLNAGKRSVGLTDEDLVAGIASDKLVRLCGWADAVLIDDVWVQRLSLRQALSGMLDKYPNLIISTVTPYGWTGPYSEFPATDINMAALGGISYGVGEPDGSPLPLPYSQCEFHAGLCTAIATQMADFARDTYGVGQHVDIGIAELLASLHTGYFLVRFFYGGLVGRRNGRVGSGTPYPNTVFKCLDGYVTLNTPQVAQWIRLLHLMGDPEWNALPRYRDRRAMQWQYKSEADSLLAPWFAARSKAELQRLFVDSKLPYAVQKTGEDLLTEEHLIARGKIREVGYADGRGCLKVPGPEHTGLIDQGGAELTAPELGGASEFAESLADGPTGALPRVDSAGRAGGQVADLGTPLAGLRILDLGTAWAGGIAGRILGDFGCDVIKVESWSHMDGSRKGRPIVSQDVSGGDEGQWPDLQPGFHVHGRSKRSIAVNLKTKGGREVLKRLIGGADALIHNFPVGVMERLGFTEETIHAANPHCVVVGQSVAGTTGPLRNYIGYAHTVSALSSLAISVGYEGQEPIGLFEGLYCDVVSALSTVNVVLAGLRARRGDGHARSVEISQWEATLAFCAESLLRAQVGPSATEGQGYFHPLYFPYGMFKSAGDDEWLSIAVRNDSEWISLCGILRAPTGWHSAKIEDRRQMRQLIDDAIAKWSIGLGAWTAARQALDAGIPSAPVYNVEKVFADEHFQDRATFVFVDHPLVGSEAMSGMPWRLSATPGRVSKHAPLLGQHSKEIAVSLAGYSEVEYEELLSAGVIESGPSREGKGSAQ